LRPRLHPAAGRGADLRHGVRRDQPDRGPFLRHAGSPRVATGVGNMGERRFRGEVAIVTGAAHGIGRAIAVELAREGASVWACDVLERELAETRRAVGERAEGPCRVAVVDVTDAARVSAFVEELVKAEGRVDVVVN